MFNSSPLGDFVFYMCAEKHLKEIDNKQFSSPFGAFVFYINKGDNCNDT